MYIDEVEKNSMKYKNIEADYEKIKEQSTKMAQQLHKLNQDRLEKMKENQYLKYQLEKQTENFMGSQLSVSSSRRASNIPVALSQKNFSTEDEEGEVFSTTYLMDLKAGRMTSSRDTFDFEGRKTLPLEEIQRRNSKFLPHLRSAYWADTLDTKICEDEIRVG